MVRIKVVKLSQILYIALVVVLAIAAIALLVRALPARAETDTSADTSIITIAATHDEARQGDSSAPETAPLFSSQQEAKPSRSALAAISRVIFGVDVTDPRSMLASSGFSESQRNTDVADAIPVTADELVETEHEDPTVSPETIEIEVREAQPYEPPARADGLRALLYHTHTHEAYDQMTGDAYVETSKWRTADYSHSIVSVGADLAQALAQHGIEVVHDRSDFEPPKLGTAYERSLKMLNGYVDRKDTYDFYIDLHRDAYSKQWLVGNDDTSTIMIDGKPCARIMVLIGNGEGSSGSGGFSIKPNWKENYKLATALTDQLNADHPGLARSVMVKTGRYNQHISNNSILIEVGHNLNTLAEARNTMPYLAEALAQTIGR